MTFEPTLTAIATATFAVTGVLAAAERDVDVFGVIVLGTVTAVGGGTIRDLLLGVPPFWLADTTFLWVAVGASLATFLFAKTLRRTERPLLYLDGFGAALFGVQGTVKAMGYDLAFPVAAGLGVLSAIGGGLIRDLLAGRQTLIMRREFYATPILIGCLLFAWLGDRLPSPWPLGIGAVALIFAFRAAAIRWSWSMPEWTLVKGSARD